MYNPGNTTPKKSEENTTKKINALRATGGVHFQIKIRLPTEKVGASPPTLTQKSKMAAVHVKL